jgi:hypothetical protein
MAGAYFHLARGAIGRATIVAGLIAAALASSACGEPWKERPYDPPIGSRWTIQSESSDTKTLPNAETNSTTHTRAELTIEAKTATGYQVSYVVTEISIDGNAPEVALMRPILPMMKGFVVHAKLDTRGRPVAIDNLDEARGHLQAFGDAVAKNFDSQPKMAEFIRSLLDKPLHAEGADAAPTFMPEVAELAQGQNTGIMRDETRHETSTIDNPLGAGAPIKTSNATRVDKADPKTGNVTYVRDGRADEESMRAFARAIVSKLLQGDQSGGQADEVLKAVTIVRYDMTTIDVEGGMARSYRQDSTISLSLQKLKVDKKEATTITVTPAT